MAPEQAIEKVVNQKPICTTSAPRCTACSPAGSCREPLPSPETEGKSRFPPSSTPRSPADLNTLIVACLQSDPDNRPADMFEVRDQLSKIAKQMGLEEVDLKGADEE